MARTSLIWRAPSLMWQIGSRCRRSRARPRSTAAVMSRTYDLLRWCSLACLTASCTARSP
eukprot:439982-Prymnesium_polylepis.2